MRQKSEGSEFRISHVRERKAAVSCYKRQKYTYVDTAKFLA